MIPRTVKGLIKYRRERLREVHKAHRDRLKAADRLAASLRRVSTLIVRAYRLANGEPSTSRSRTVTKQPSHDMDSPYTPILRDLIDRARQGDETALPALRTLLDESPGLWKQVGDLAKHVESAWMKLLAGNDLFTLECIQRGAEERRQDWLGDDPTPIERHMVERIVASWLHVQHAGILAATSRDVSECQRNVRQKRLESAQKYHLAAVKQLYTIRREAKAAKRKAEKNRNESNRNQSSRKRVRRRVVVT